MHSVAKTVGSAGSLGSSSRLSSRTVVTMSNYGVALLSVAIAAIIAYPFRAQIYTTPLFLAAVVIAAWYGGVGPGTLAVLATIAVIHYLFQLPGVELKRPHHYPARLAGFRFFAAIASTAVAR